jgi:hypothetical protein
MIRYHSTRLTVHPQERDGALTDQTTNSDQSFISTYSASVMMPLDRGRKTEESAETQSKGQNHSHSCSQSHYITQEGLLEFVRISKSQV